MLACCSRLATAGSRTRPSSIPRKITLLVVGMRLNTGAELVVGKDTGVGAGCWGRPSPGTRRGTVVVGGGAVVVVGGRVEDAATMSSPTAWMDAAAGGFASAPPASWNGPSPNSTTSAT